VSNFETEDQQVEDLKKWWKENGKAVIAGVVLGFSAIFAGRMYIDHLENQRIQASIEFERMNMAEQQQQKEAMFSYGEQIVSTYPGTPYAAMASLALAKWHVEKGELEAAQNRLQWIIDHEDQPDIVHVARLRLARVFLAEAKPDLALGLLANVDTEAYTSIYQELRGDIYLAKNQLEQARTAYAAALETLNERDDRQVLQMKFDDLGV
jgi:predicted negative regulator of RcsB-dependent stress response